MQLLNDREQIYHFTWNISPQIDASFRSAIQINSVLLVERQFRHVCTACFSLGLAMRAIKLAQVSQLFALNMNFGSVNKSKVNLIKHLVMSKHSGVEV